MHFSINRDKLLHSLSYTQGIVEKKNTLPILSNVLINAKNDILTLVATDLDIFFYEEIKDVKITSEGSTTTSANVLYDILRKISSKAELNFEQKSQNKLSLTADNSDFNLLCLPSENFPVLPKDETNEEIKLESTNLLSLINKVKISISNDDTRHYLNGIYFHITGAGEKNYLTGVATDSHRLSSSSLEIPSLSNNISFILPKKTVFQLSNLLSDIKSEVKFKIGENKIEFLTDNKKIISKVIDGKFPDYKKVVPSNNNKKLVVNCKDFIDSVERVTTVSLDRKEGIKLELLEDQIKLSVSSTSSGDGNELLKSNYKDKSFVISFNSKYLIDIASVIENQNIEFLLNDGISPVLITDQSDKDSFYVVMPMKI
ncbi:MAG: DNA polymerase III subunit beta [Candidatus Pelagibacter sp.]|nr:DNA polymerase III subunit beta [Candidatus Pelagibacter sp.]OUW23965.1 MAG: DNA polymerase III subunit beta [Rickettsiales bacterium TMED174]|tara:strand:+ start:1266 stop:2381 length:1116 start_codon:yes stop_codon:yes gene_type:complete